MSMSICLPILAILVSSAGDIHAEDVTKVPDYDQFILIPLRIHVLTSKTINAADCHMTDAEVAMTALRINQIWHKAGIHFGVESIVREPAAQEARYQALEERVINTTAERFALCGMLLPPASRLSNGMNLYLAGEIPLNGGYLMAADAVIVNEIPQLRQVEGGTEHSVSRVASRGLGVALGLGIRPDDFGLISSSTNGVGLNQDEVARARSVARIIPGTRDVETAKREAEAATTDGDLALARALWTWLSEIPGGGAAVARQRLSSIPSGKP